MRRTFRRALYRPGHRLLPGYAGHSGLPVRPGRPLGANGGRRHPVRRGCVFHPQRGGELPGERQHPAVFCATAAAGPGKGGPHRPRTADGAPHGGLRRPVPGAVSAVPPGGGPVVAPGTAAARPVSAGRGRQLPVHHRPAVRPAPAGGGQRGQPPPAGGQPALYRDDPPGPGTVRRHFRLDG